MLTKLERDRAVGQVQGLKSTLKSVDQLKSGSRDGLLNGGISQSQSRTLSGRVPIWD